jgi:CubicO group peptidase (beta-lactamase class C family)
LTIALAGVLLVGAAFVPPDAQGSRAAAIDQIFRPWASDATPGCAVAVVHNGTKVVDRAFGSADLERGVPNTTSTLFEAGSTSKQFTAAAVLILAQEGRLSLSDDVRNYVPELPDYGHTITINHLLTHTSGLREWGSLAIFEGWPRGTRANNQLDALASIARQRSLNHLPGTRYSYNNSGYILLRLIVERVSGQGFSDFTRERIFLPLGMSHTQWRDDLRRVVRGRAIAYQRVGGVYEQTMPFEHVVGNGGLLTTTGDLLLWNEALERHTLGAAVTQGLQTRAALSDGEPLRYARGLFLISYRGFEEISHPGQTAAYTAWLGRYPQFNLSIALLCNAADADSVRLAHEVADQFLPGRPERGGSPLSPREAQRRQGLYVDPRNGLPLTIVAEGSRLRTSGGAQLEPLGGGRFRMGEEEVRFGNDALTVDDPYDQPKFYRRIVPAATSADERLSPAGRYVSTELNQAYLIESGGAGLRLRFESRPYLSIPLERAYPDAYFFSAYQLGGYPGAQGLISFVRDADHRVTELRVSSSRVWNLRLRRDEATPAAPQP